jgi:hypothetical protein
MFADRDLGAENSTSFDLRKWYLDCVDEEGNAAIAYWARLRWRYIKLYYSSVSVNGAERASLRRCEEPRIDGAALSWRRSASMKALESPIRRRLFESGEGVVDWSCEMPRAEAEIAGVRGVGYAEVLRMTVPPWKLPIDELRWGRFLGSDTSVVWIDWRGAAPQTVVLRNGNSVGGASVLDDEVRLNDATLRFDRARELQDRAIGDALPLLRDARERKWCGRGTLDGAGGWAVHEVVTFGAP